MEYVEMKYRQLSFIYFNMYNDRNIEDIAMIYGIKTKISNSISYNKLVIT